jgi:hypothetical protein
MHVKALNAYRQPAISHATPSFINSLLPILIVLTMQPLTLGSAS